MLVKCFEKEKNNVSVSAKYIIPYFLHYVFLNRSLMQCSYGLLVITVILNSNAVLFSFCKWMNEWSQE